MSDLVAPGLSRVPQPILEQLFVDVARGRVDCPLAEADLLASGYGALAPMLLAAFDGLATDAVLTALRLVIAERVHRPPPRLNLVWTGPEGRASVSRDTALAVRELFVSAQRSVIVGGYSFDKPEILEPLHAAMRDNAVQVMLFMDIAGEARSANEADGVATATIDRFFREVWTFGEPKPDVYYDPRTALRGPPWASLHAKCIVVDEVRTLITSANFTDRGQTRNIEAGVMIDDEAFAEELSAQWRKLIAAGLVRQYRG